MAELVDATDSKSVVRKDVQVRFLFWAHRKVCKSLIYRLFDFTGTGFLPLFIDNTLVIKASALSVVELLFVIVVVFR